MGSAGLCAPIAAAVFAIRILTVQGHLEPWLHTPVVTIQSHFAVDVSCISDLRPLPVWYGRPAPGHSARKIAPRGHVNAA